MKTNMNVDSRLSESLIRDAPFIMFQQYDFGNTLSETGLLYIPQKPIVFLPLTGGNDIKRVPGTFNSISFLLSLASLSRGKNVDPTRSHGNKGIATMNNHFSIHCLWQITKFNSSFHEWKEYPSEKLAWMTQLARNQLVLHWGKGLVKSRQFNDSFSRGKSTCAS